MGTVATSRPITGGVKVNLRVGLKFRSAHFSATAEIKEIRKDKNQLDVILFNGEDGFVDKGWNLEHTVWGFEKGDYWEVEPKINFGI